MQPKIGVVTGANCGIGKETARGLAQMGFQVVLACRDAARANAARDELIAATGNRDIHAMSLDLSRVDSIDRFIAAFRKRFDRLDLLINNAGAMWRERTLTSTGLEATFATNHLGPFALTLGLLDLLEKSAPSRVIMISSKLHLKAKLELDDLGYEIRKYAGFDAYGASKLANVIFVRTLARRLGESGVRINAVHPGEAATLIARDYGKAMTLLMRILYRSPKVASVTPLYAATAPEADVSGEYFMNSRVAPHSPLADDLALQDRLWSVSEELLRSARSGGGA
jgi:NAD(P)-dependent dehydrogenase (short-subunit alcohol dehydrogenase family)